MMINESVVFGYYDKGNKIIKVENKFFRDIEGDELNYLFYSAFKCKLISSNATKTSLDKKGFK